MGASGSKTHRWDSLPSSRALAGCVALALLMAFGILPETGAVEVSKEYQVKALLVYHFTQFVQWPPEAVPSGAPLRIGVLGDDPFGAVMDLIAREEGRGDHAIVVERYQEPEEARDCHILFVSSSEKARLSRVLAELKGHPVLTVGDCDGFTDAGGMVQLFTNAEGKIRLRVNLPAVRLHGLNMSSRLLRVAEVVPPGS
jgi:hypothetical protein